MHGVSFKKRAPRAVKEIRKFATLSMVGLPFPIPPSFLSLSHLIIHTGHERRPPRPTAEQESLGIWYQGRAFQTTRTNQQKTKRRGGREGEVVQLRTGREREGAGVEGADDGGRGGVVMTDWLWR